MESFFVFVLGAIFGSFYNVCIHRIPREESIVAPRSKCPHCGMLIKWYQNIPILSWILLRGKCSHCSNKITPRYLCVELFTGLVFLTSYIYMQGWPMIILGWIFSSVLIIAAFIDLEHLIIPDRFTIGGFVLGITVSMLYPALHGYSGAEPFILDNIRGLTTGLIGALVGSGLLLWITLIAEAILKEDAMGFGDIKFMGFVGAFIGWEGAIFAIFGGSILGCLMYFPLRSIVKNNPDTDSPHIPFGPALALASFLYMFFLQNYIQEYFQSVKDLFF